MEPASEILGQKDGSSELKAAQKSFVFGKLTVEESKATIGTQKDPIGSVDGFNPYDHGTCLDHKG